MMIGYEVQDALHTLRNVEREIANIYWVQGGKSALNEGDLERWAGEIHQAYEVLREVIYDHIDA